MRSIVVAPLLAIACGASTALDSASTDVFVRGILRPPERTTNAACVYSSDRAKAIFASGLVDVSLAQSYKPTLLVGNARRSGGVDDGRVTITGASVRVADFGGATIGAFTSVASGFIDGATSEPAYATYEVELLDAATTAAIAKQLAHGTLRFLVTITLEAKTASGDAFPSIPYQFPIDVCRGCLVTFPPESVDRVLEMRTGKTNCAAPLTSDIVIPCVPGQDQPIDCRLCRGLPACTPAE